MTIETLLITPALAADLLLKNIINRKIKQGWVAHLAHQMNAGTFNSLNGQTIVIDRDGKLLDGQHRLLAVVKSGQSFRFVVINGADPSAFKTIDTGIKRSAGDLFHADGVSNGRNISSIVFFYIKLTRGFVNAFSSGRNRVRVSNQDMLKVYNERAEFYQNIFGVAQGLYIKIRLLNLSMLGGMMAYTTQHSQFKDRCIEEFWTPLMIGGGNGVVSLCREKLIKEQLKTRSVPHSYKTAWIIRAYNAHFLNKDLKLIKYASDQEFPTFE